LPLTSQYIHRGWHHGLFRRESLQRIGGYYGGFRIAYDVFLMNLLLMTGRVAYVDQPLYNRWLRAESLENAAATGMRSPLRAEVHRRLGRSYTDVFKQYQAYLQGSLSWAELVEAISTISARYVTAQDQTALVEETERLRTLLEIRPPVMTPLALAAPPKTIATPAAVALESRLSQLLHSPQLPWKDGAISKTVAVELVHRLQVCRPQQLLGVGSGISTVLLAQCAAELGARVTTLEHDPISYQRTRQFLAEFGLQRHVDLRLSPLTQHTYGPGECYFWYDTPLAGHYDFVFINGPPQKFGRQAVLLALADHLTPTWEAWLHDGHRAHEQQCLTRWQAQLPFTSGLYSLDAKGIWILSDEALPASFCFPASLTGKLGMSILTGQRLDLLKQAVQSLQIYAQELLEQSYVLVMVNGNDPSTNAYVDTLPFVNQILRHQGSILPIGTATSRLMQKLAGHAEYLIHLEDDWCISSLDQRWVESAAAILSAHPEIGQVRLRHRGETVLPYHMITRKPILWRWQDEFLVADQAHFTFNPHMLRSRDVPRIYPCQTEADAQHHFVRTELASAQLSPGIFRHIGAGKSLRQKLGRR
jgi:hypothetical protein